VQKRFSFDLQHLRFQPALPSLPMSPGAASHSERFVLPINSTAEPGSRSLYLLRSVQVFLIEEIAAQLGFSPQTVGDVFSATASSCVMARKLFERRSAAVRKHFPQVDCDAWPPSEKIDSLCYFAFGDGGTGTSYSPSTSTVAEPSALYATL
jgi:hypothetical protein